MPPSHLKCCFAACLVLFCDAALAEDTPAAQTSSVLLPQQKTEDTPLYLHADHIEGTANQQVKARGNVELQRNDTVLTSDYLQYTLDTDEAHATGDVTLQQQGLRVSGPELRVRLADQVGQMQQPVYSLTDLIAHTQATALTRKIRGAARLLDFEGKGQYRLKDATYTTCPVNNDDWYLHVKDLNIDRGREVGTARNAYLEFKGVPILYTPFMDFSLNNQRKSGLLAPTFGTTGSSGLELRLPYYWNIAPNYDATISPRIMTKRGLQLGGEFRYLADSYRGILNGEFLADKATNTNRWSVLVNHQQNFAPGWSGHLHYERVSDNNYFRDLSNQISITSITNLSQEGGVNYTAGWWSAAIRAQKFQTLQDPLAPIVPPYNLLPQLTLNANRYDWHGVDFSFTGEAVHFDHPTLVTGTRVSAYPSFSMPMANNFAYLTPKFGVSQTNYYLDSSTLPNTVRTLPITSVDSGFYMDRNTRLFGRNYQQTLEPRFFYVYIPYQDQSQIPNFDSGQIDFNFAQMFTENRFAGGDRINDANQLTAAVTSRLIEPDSGLERLRVSLGQRFYFAPQRVVLPGGVPNASTSSDVLASVGGQISQAWRAEAAVQFNTNLGASIRDSISANYRPAPGKTLNLSYRIIRGTSSLDAIRQVDISAQWPLAPRWYGLMRYNYSFVDGRLVEGLAGLEYNAGCWAARGVLQRIATATGTSSNSFFIQLELNGIGRLGSNPLDVLKQSISGYVNTNELQNP
ncbi:LPS-assembly protein LptD [Sulfuriferula plumbiphila]|uniref:LPS-assembly protein LptD n=1 Tax=Sulfuriferula plumbiphila TaxID=171865 RepID=A0A512L6Y4_9PROT|nr:LPS-assembly protein LptD [Sulfuriferula plumbiphila]BBP02897.1 LPS-assembly protein LptD [Sulfuriferula plumbiphila]GEP30236.1 LPS-assembly protein LptD [Sulfuriferula plumbiphila]